MPIAPLVEGGDRDGAELAGSAPEAVEPASGSRRAEPELVAVPMDADQEAVYGWLGLNPTLLLDQPPAGDNVVVRVVRPDADAAAVLDEARQQLATSATRRRRGRGGRGNGAAQAEMPQPEASRLAPVEITPLPLQLEPETVVTVSVPTRQPAPAVAEPVAAAPVEPELDDAGKPRRRRRRSSASS
jgi:ribonuclease E